MPALYAEPVTLTTAADRERATAEWATAEW